jgi:hypothetical protein
MKRAPYGPRALAAVLGASLVLATACGDDPSDDHPDALPTDASPEGGAISPEGGAASAEGGALDAGTGAEGGPGNDGPASDGIAVVAPAPPLAAPGPLFCGRPGLIYSGQEPTVDVFPVQDGLLLVRQRSLLLVDRLGRLIRSVPTARDVLAAAFDGTTLTVVERAMMHTFRRDLVKTGSRLLTDLCDAALLLPDGRTLCSGGDVDRSRRYVYGPGETPGTFAGLGRVAGVRRVPGRAAFVNTEYGFSYLVPKPSGELEAKGTASFDGKGVPRPAFGFLGDPATHVVDVMGNLLKIDESECTPSPAPFNSKCFSVDGQLGTVGVGQAYAGVVEDSPTTVVGLLNKDERNSFQTGPCLMGCQVQRIDVATRKVLSERTHRLDARAIKLVRNDPFCDRLLVLGRTTEEPRFTDPDRGGDYRVHLLDHSDPKQPELPPAGQPAPTPTLDPLSVPPAPPTPAGPCAPPRTLYNGEQAVLAAEPVAEGVIIVTAKSVVLMGRDGVAKATVPATSDITAVAVDGTRLVIADAAPGLTILAPNTLATVARMTTPEACSGLVLLDGPRVICGGTKDWDRIFYTLDLGTKAEVARSAKYTYKGLPMFRVPGRSQFITVNSTSSSGYFGLFDVAADGTASFVNDSGGSEVGSDSNFAFLGQPADRIVTIGGGLARIVGPDCKSGPVFARTGCFTREGQLGVIGRTQFHVSMTSDDDGMVYALASAENRAFSIDGRCGGGGCNLQRIDVANRRVVSQRPAYLSVETVLGSRFDRACGTVVMAYQSSRTDVYSAGRFVVQTLDFRAPKEGETP